MAAMIRRGKHRSDYTILPNLIFEHPELSAAAKGTLCYLLSRPPGWEIRHQHLRHIMQLGRDAFKRVMAEIISAGFAWRSDEQQRNGDNSFLGYDYVVYDQPQDVEIDRAAVGFPTTGSRCRKPDSGNKEGDTQDLDSNLSQERRSAENDHSAEKKPAGERGFSETGSNGEPVKGSPLNSDDDGWNDVPPRDREIETPADEEVVSETGDNAEPVSNAATASLAEFQAAWGTSAIDNVTRTMRAFGALTPDERRAAIAGIKPFRAEMERARRTHSIAGWRYLEEKRWALLPATVGEWSQVKPLSRDWWAILFARIERGEKVGFFVSQTINSGNPWTTRTADMPTLDQVARLEAYPSDGDVMNAWRPWLEAHRVRVPTRDTLWVFLPGAVPPPANASLCRSEHAA